MLLKVIKNLIKHNAKFISYYETGGDGSTTFIMNYGSPLESKVVISWHIQAFLYSNSIAGNINGSIVINDQSYASGNIGIVEEMAEIKSILEKEKKQNKFLDKTVATAKLLEI